ncbi:MAG: protease inhibitor I42 family protein [Spirochaetales bacterium]|nr:protease inhibitor I42 family protein [Spirochaetales bacterium]
MKRSIFYLALILLLFQFTGCSSLSKAEYSIKVGETINIELESNWSTGYQWHFINSDAVTVVAKSDMNYGADESGDDQIDDEEELCGAPGVEVWRFTGMTPGKETLNFHYKRSWENRIPEERAKITITVEK